MHANTCTQAHFLSQIYARMWPWCMIFTLYLQVCQVVAIKQLSVFVAVPLIIHMKSVKLYWLPFLHTIKTLHLVLCSRFVYSLAAVTARQHATVQWQWSQVMMSSCLIAVGHSKGKQMGGQSSSRCWSMENSQLALVSFAGMMERHMRSVLEALLYVIAVTLCIYERLGRCSHSCVNITVTYKKYTDSS